ncbi:methyltransferase family protein [Motilibacter rhizosphaerae]|uniref:Methyltransferase family protein n=1 Tax=Motilibacter rhizosphaerae TaxID=598652 RepID=A0A4Q7NG50_9ACTN|nr:class I SAM-dependent methyltransferase [Motilibacter rhizosphaerae]RZS82718.1 methyltransferase family protein [Motilibacter rhizosphaerae]
MTTNDQDELARLLSEEAWDERYSEHSGAMWSGEPNPALVAEVRGLPPGKALDAGCGEGGDAIWLAQRGWEVTGVDLSSVALDKAAAAAAPRGVQVTWQHLDPVASPLPAATYDLVTSSYVHLPEEQRRALHANLAQAVVPGGTLLLVQHHPSFAHGNDHPLAQYGLLLTPEQLADDLDPEQWEVVVCAVRERAHVHAGDHPVLDSVLRARKRVG